MSSFYRCNRRESPAGTALTLVLYRVYCTIRNPVNRVGNIIGWNFDDILFFCWHWLVSEDFFIFSICPVRHFVETELVGGLCLIMRDDFFEFASELMKSELVLIKCAVGLPILCDVTEELMLNL